MTFNLRKALYQHRHASTDARLSGYFRSNTGHRADGLGAADEFGPNPELIRQEERNLAGMSEPSPAFTPSRTTSVSDLSPAAERARQFRERLGVKIGRRPLVPRDGQVSPA